MSITEFLQARIAEDEAWWESASLDGPQAEALLRKQKRECEAKRAIIAEACEVTHMFEGGLEDYGWAALRALASIYADHFDYDEAWRI